jgi:hypothetical protein
LFKSLFTLFEADESNRFHDAEAVAMVTIMGVVVANHTTIVARVEVVIDLSQVVSRDFPCLIDPDLPP